MESRATAKRKRWRGVNRGEESDKKSQRRFFRGGAKKRKATGRGKEQREPHITKISRNGPLKKEKKEVTAGHERGAAWVDKKWLCVEHTNKGKKRKWERKPRKDRPGPATEKQKETTKKRGRVSGVLTRPQGTHRKKKNALSETKVKRQGRGWDRDGVDKKKGIEESNNRPSNCDQKGGVGGDRKGNKVFVFGTPKKDNEPRRVFRIWMRQEPGARGRRRPGDLETKGKVFTKKKKQR